MLCLLTCTTWCEYNIDIIVKHQFYAESGCLCFDAIVEIPNKTEIRKDFYRLMKMYTYVMFMFGRSCSLVIRSNAIVTAEADDE